ncbi:MAG: ribosome maturation factor RimP [Clostridia bacterium]|nr:ribosome maturation factor RimP [Clostridia bacterium]
MAKKIEEIILELAEPVASEHGVYVVDVSYKKTNDGYSLCLYLDKEGGIGIDDCEVFSRAFENVMDEKDPIENNYVLEVSSPGVDRKLVKDREFLYYLGREVDVKLYKAIDGKKEFTGILTDYKDKTAYIEFEEETLKIPAKEAAYIKLSFRF